MVLDRLLDMVWETTVFRGTLGNITSPLQIRYGHTIFEVWEFHNSFVNYDNTFGLRAREESYFLFHLFYRYQIEESVLFAIIDLVWFELHSK